MTLPNHSFTYEAMTTLFEVIIEGVEQEYARQAAGAVFREIDRINDLLNKYDPGSDIGQVNLLKPGESVRVTLEAIECLERAVWAHTVSGGLFDPTLGTGFQWLEIDRANFSIGWKKDGKGEVNLGGIGKGYAIDLAKDILADWDIEKAVINGGTSTVLALGKKWDIGVGGPWGEKVGLTQLKLEDQALSGSGTEVKGDHIVNPKTGKPAQRHLAAWAVHPSAAASDALSTAFMMMPPEKIEVLCRENPEITAFVVKQDKSLIKIGV
ncbi:FAD:protein FMN transferase [Pontiellaceae bacterium B12227]|nr:FAD:protein FMN transferase [Pontiellaceae bacterium B12227]